MARLASANDIVNRAALEVGLSSNTDPFTSLDDTYIQLMGLLNGCGQELVELHAWQILKKQYRVVTTAVDTGSYALPDNFSYMIDQTGWELSNSVPVGGPLSSQDWAYLRGRDLVSQSIFVSFRLVDNMFDIYPNTPVAAGLDINFEYISRDWVLDDTTTTYYDSIQAGANLVLYEPIVVVKFLKAKYLEAKGFDASSARLEFENMFLSRTGKDEGASVLSASNNSRGYPYLSPYNNTSDSGYGL